MSNPVLQVVVGSARPGRVGPAVAEWFAGVAAEHDQFDIELVDLLEVNLPLLDEPKHPRLQQYTQPHTKRWSETVSRADAFVFVHPEYNYGFNAALKNAIDYLSFEWRHKPVSFVSYGGASGGLRATQMLKQVVSALGMVPVTAAVTVPFASKHINGAGVFEANDLMVDSVKATVSELRAMTEALAVLREKTAV